MEEYGHPPEELHEYPRPYGVASLSFEQVSALNSQLAARYESERLSDGFEEAEQSWNAIFDEVRQFIREDPPRATELMRQLTYSESPYDREVAAYNVDELCTVDVEAGMELWIKLLLADPNTSETAEFTIRDRFDPRRYSPESLVYMFEDLAESLSYWHYETKRLQRDQRAE